ncbi:MAG: PTS system mannose/fructose/sorbose family transporter subunit IID [Streptococcaceae bacterium]|jgi:PTS system mannose-specific IID component|nr:PTS system mannose/fructose/sorbose family transporter subunit IID [Streptococcaceae bacterium]
MTKINEINKIDEKDLKKVWLRNIFGLQWGWNYEGMQALGYAFSIMPILKKLYGNNKEKLIKALKVHVGFFNTTPIMSTLILGADTAVEEKFGIDDEDAVIGLKTGLMGPFAGIGDTVFVAIYRAICYSIAAYLCLGHNPLGLLFPFVFGLLLLWLRYRFLLIGYEQGSKVVSGLSGSIKTLTDAASVLGLTVVGGLIPSVITYKLMLSYKLGKVTMNVQEMLDKILPALLPLAIVGLSYWLLGKKKMNSTRLIFALIVLGMLLGNLQGISDFIAALFK